MRLARVLPLLALACLAACSTLNSMENPSVNARASDLPAKAWTADNGNGTYSNPLFYEEFEDPDVIRVGDTYYLAGTTMHMNPAVQLMQSKDLVNWELAGYCTDRLDLGPAFRLENGNIYGQGIWAPCIRYHNGTFYVFTNVNGAGLQVFRSKSIKGPWERNQLPGRHDLSVLFDDDGRVFIISSANAPYPIEELTPDLRAFKTDAPKRSLPDRMGEGHHLYKINGKYVDVSAIPGAATDQMVAVADAIDGPWKVTRMVQGESLGVTGATPAKAQPNDRGLWIHQGGIVDTPGGEWWSIIMSDHGSAGRMVNLVPVTWDGGFPLIGLPGNLRKAPNTWLKPNTGFTQAPMPAFIHDDPFEGKLNQHAQWNHVPDDSKWSLTEKPGVLRLHSLPAPNFYTARNTLCHRPPGPESIMTVELDTSGMTNGDVAGLGLVSTPWAWIGMARTADGDALQMTTGAAPPRGRAGRGGPAATAPSAPPTAPVASVPNPPKHLWLRVHCNFDTDQAVFSWSADGKAFQPLGTPFTTTFQLTTFQGVRPGLFHYNAAGTPGGYADFDNYTTQEPRARGIEREIPIGKTIVLTSSADGSVLAADRDKLVNLAAGGTAPENARFQVIDMGLGRVALKTANGMFLSAVGPESAILKDLAGSQPGTAETFQWINLMRGDTMLMSLANHQYLATKPNRPGPVTVNALGPAPARKSGAEFKWQAVSPS
jgi:beta-xylosidase